MQSQKNTFLENGHIVIMFATLIFDLLGLEIRSAHNKTDLAFDSYGYAPLYASAMTADEAAPAPQDIKISQYESEDIDQYVLITPVQIRSEDGSKHLNDFSNVYAVKGTQKWSYFTLIGQFAMDVGQRAVALRDLERAIL